MKKQGKDMILFFPFF